MRGGGCSSGGRGGLDEGVVEGWWKGVSFDIYVKGDWAVMLWLDYGIRLRMRVIDIVGCGFFIRRACITIGMC